MSFEAVLPAREQGPAGADAAEAKTPGRRGRRRHEFTGTQEMLLRFFAGETVLNGGATCTKRELAERMGRNVKTIDRCVADLRRRGLVDVEMCFDERGGQVASIYRVTGPDKT